MGKTGQKSDCSSLIFSESSALNMFVLKKRKQTQALQQTIRKAA
jgi:hypothetical protein